MAVPRAPLPGSVSVTPESGVPPPSMARPERRAVPPVCAKSDAPRRVPTTQANADRAMPQCAPLARSRATCTLLRSRKSRERECAERADLAVRGERRRDDACDRSARLRLEVGGRERGAAVSARIPRYQVYATLVHPAAVLEQRQAVHAHEPVGARRHHRDERDERMSLPDVELEADEPGRRRDLTADRHRTRAARAYGRVDLVVERRRASS